jgi:hypothetical protein
MIFELSCEPSCPIGTLTPLKPLPPTKHTNEPDTDLDWEQTEKVVLQSAPDDH